MGRPRTREVTALLWCEKCRNITGHYDKHKKTFEYDCAVCGRRRTAGVMSELDKNIRIAIRKKVEEEGK